MKKITTLIAVVFIGLSTTFAQKYGHVDAQAVLKDMSEFSQAEQEIERVRNNMIKEMQTLQATYQKSVQEYQQLANAGNTSEMILQSRATEIMEMEQNIQQFQINSEESLQKKQAQLLEPMVNRVKEAIKVVGKENGYTYIFDASTGVLLFMDETKDVTELVKKQLAKTQAAKAATTAPAGTGSN